MSNCIAAVSRPRNVLPSFVPIEEGIPTTPSRIELDTPDDLDQDFIPPAPEPLTEP
jgi:molecular chaperone DnaK (HSP70)